MTATRRESLLTLAQVALGSICVGFLSGWLAFNGSTSPMTSAPHLMPGSPKPIRISG